MKPYTDSVQVQRDIDEVFNFITNISNIEIMFEHIINVVPVVEEKPTESRKFHQTRLVHGIQWHEVAEVTAFEKNTHYMFSLSMFGVETTYAYTLKSMDNHDTWVQLSKAIHGKGFRQLLHPLIAHLLTRPEHDGNHLNVLKQAIECRP